MTDDLQKLNSSLKIQYNPRLEKKKINLKHYQLFGLLLSHFHWQSFGIQRSAEKFVGSSSCTSLDSSKNIDPVKRERNEFQYTWII